MKILTAVLTAFATSICLATPATAQSTTPDAFTDSYCTRISNHDKVASDGTKLRDAASILRQDRANFHRFGKADSDDQGDATFATTEARARMPDLYAKGSTDPKVGKEIVSGNPIVCVDIMTRSMAVGISTEEALHPKPVEYAFAGKWTCEGKAYTISAAAFNDGGKDQPIIEAQEGTDGGYALFLTEESLVAVSAVKDNKMTMTIPGSDKAMMCERKK